MYVLSSNSASSYANSAFIQANAAFAAANTGGGGGGYWGGRGGAMYTGGGGGSTPSGGGGAEPQNVITPNFNIVGNNGTNQLAQLKQAPIQAYVVSGEMSTQQSLDRNRLRNATL